MKQSLWTHPAFDGTLRFQHQHDILHSVSYVRAGEQWEHSPLPSHFVPLTEWLALYTETPLLAPCAPLEQKYRLHGTPFQESIWQALSLLNVGEILSYQELGCRASHSSRSARAVGSAVGKNPFIILIPCHRILPLSGKLGGYSGEGGTARKRLLLNHEGIII